MDETFVKNSIDLVQAYILSPSFFNVFLEVVLAELPSIDIHFILRMISLRTFVTPMIQHLYLPFLKNFN